MTATSIAPLRNKDGHGKIYSRLPEIESKLAKVLVLSPGEIQERLKLEKDAVDYIPSECLVYIIREYRSKELDSLAEGVVKELVKRILSGLPPAESINGEREHLANANFHDEVRYRFIALLAGDRQEYNPKLDIYEVRFQMGLAALKASAWRKVRRNENRPAENIEVDSETGEISAKVEEAALEANHQDTHLLDDPVNRNRLYSAIDNLPDMQRAIVMMWLEGIPMESNESGTVSMSSSLGKTPKTIATHRDLALATLREALNGATQ